MEPACKWLDIHATVPLRVGPYANGPAMVWNVLKPTPLDAANHLTARDGEGELKSRSGRGARRYRSTGGAITPGWSPAIVLAQCRESGQGSTPSSTTVEPAHWHPRGLGPSEALATCSTSNHLGKAVLAAIVRQLLAAYRHRQPMASRRGTDRAIR